MPKPKGGRGHSAPYETRQARIPEPIISQVHELIERYQNYVSSGGNSQNPPRLLDSKPVDSFKEELDETIKIVNRFEESVYNASLILRQALQLKANAGGAIKREIEKALALLG